MKKLLLKLELALYLTIIVSLFIISPTANKAETVEAEGCACSPATGGYSNSVEAARQSVTCGTGWNIGTMGFRGSANPADLYYLMIYDTRIKPEEETVTQVGEMFGFSETEIRQLVDNTLDPIFQNETKLTQEQAIARLAKIQNKFDRVKKLKEMEYSITAELSPLEIYSNRDTSDSGFDLYVDLDIIEYILFGGDLSSQSSGSPYSNSGGKDQNKEQERYRNQEKDSNESKQGKQPDDDKTDDQRDNQTEQGDEGEGSNKSVLDKDKKTKSDIPPEDKIIKGDPDTDSEEVFNPLECLEDTGLNNAINNYNELVQSGELKGTTIKSSNDLYTQITEGKSGNKEPISGGENTGSSKTSNLNDPVASFGPGETRSETTGQDIQPAEAADYGKTPPLCNQFFCIMVEFENKEKPKYKPEENCINCHIQNINKALKETTDHVLSPSKISGNLMEISSCKLADIPLSSRLNLNIFMLGNPLKGPLQEGLLTQIDPAQTRDEIARELASDPEGLGERALGVESPDNDPITPKSENMFNEVLNELPSGVSIEDVTKTVRDFIAERKNDTATKLKQKSLEIKAGNQANFFQVLQGEMRLMTQYFQSIYDITASINKHACRGEDRAKGLLNTPVCK